MLPRQIKRRLISLVGRVYIQPLFQKELRNRRMVARFFGPAVMVGREPSTIDDDVQQGFAFFG